MSKRTLIFLLVGLNLVLLGCLIAAVYRPAMAYAQAAGGAEAGYLMVSGQVEANTDAVYLLDTQNRLLHVVRHGIPGGSVRVDTRNLAADFQVDVQPDAQGPIRNRAEGRR